MRSFQVRMHIPIAVMTMVLVALQIIREILGIYKDVRDDGDDAAK